MMEADNREYFPWENAFLIFVLVGYVVASGLAIPLGIENSRLFAVPYRVAVASWSCYYIYRNFNTKKLKSWPVLAVLLFWLLYAGKTYYSFGHDQYDEATVQQLSETYWRILLIAVLPSVALMVFPYYKVNWDKVYRGIFWVLFGALLCNAVYGIFHIQHGKPGHIFSVYYISYGHLGTSLVLVSLYGLLFQNLSRQWKSLLTCGIILGNYIIVEGFARSPFLALMVCAAFLLIIKKKWSYLAVFVGLGVMIFTVIYFLVKTGHNPLIFFDRVYLWIFEGNNSERTPLFKRGLQIFCENPVLGGRVLYEDGMYPHNIFIELLMATGIVGFVLYFSRFIPVFRTGNYFFQRQDNNEQVLFFSLFLQYFVLVLTSYSLYSTPEFLHLSAMIIGLSLYKIHEKTKSYDGGGNPPRNYTALQSS